mgnify:CR=1 FL=1
MVLHCAHAAVSPALLTTMHQHIINTLDTYFSRSRATSPSADSGAAAAAGDEANLRLTARQRAKLEKEAGVATDVAWSEMELLPNLTYTWKGKGTARRWAAPGDRSARHRLIVGLCLGPRQLKTPDCAVCGQPVGATPPPLITPK